MEARSREPAAKRARHARRLKSRRAHRETTTAAPLPAPMPPPPEPPATPADQFERVLQQDTDWRHDKGLAAERSQGGSDYSLHFVTRGPRVMALWVRNHVSRTAMRDDTLAAEDWEQAATGSEADAIARVLTAMGGQEHQFLQDWALYQHSLRRLLRHKGKDPQAYRTRREEVAGLRAQAVRRLLTWTMVLGPRQADPGPELPGPPLIVPLPALRAHGPGPHPAVLLLSPTVGASPAPWFAEPRPSATLIGRHKAASKAQIGDRDERTAAWLAQRPSAGDHGISLPITHPGPALRSKGTGVAGAHEHAAPTPPVTTNKQQQQHRA